MKKILISLVLFGLIASAFSAIYIVAVGQYGTLEKNLLSTALALMIFSLTAFSAGTWLSRYRFSAVAYGGIIASVLGFLAFVTGIWWQMYEWSDLTLWGNNRIRIVLEIVYNVSALVAFSFAHMALILHGYFQKRSINILISFTIFWNILLTFALLSYQIFRFNPPEGFWRAVVILGILILLGSVTTPILVKTSRR
ncbi:hypothetical protein HZA38_01395 [Candidatus Peregrinibacteria bacterium]|nr:hypothetical protein [Candidatus Peregrinibacteria bacterium]